MRPGPGKTPDLRKAWARIAYYLLVNNSYPCGIPHKDGRSNGEIYSNEIGFMGTADPSLAAIAHKNARWLRLVMTTFVVTFRNSIPAASATPGRPSGKKGAAGDLSYNRGKIPRAARDFYRWRIRAGAASAPWATSKQMRSVPTRQNEGEILRGKRKPLRMTWSEMMAAFAPSG
jgi:hypothetical protein